MYYSSIGRAQTTMNAQHFIGTSLRVKAKDGRLLDGVLAVVDPFGNMLMSNVFETSVDRFNPDLSHTRELGLVSVPRDQVTEILMLSTQAELLKHVV